MNKFKYYIVSPIKEREYNDISKELVSLGYKSAQPYFDGNYIKIYREGDFQSLIQIHPEEKNYIYLKKYNKELILALASMREDDIFHAGEYVILTDTGDNKSENYTVGNIYQLGGRYFNKRCQEYPFYTVKNDKGYADGNFVYKCRKATKEEIIAHFTKASKPFEVLNRNDYNTDFILPEKWAVLRDGENNKIINEYFNKINDVTSFTSIKKNSYVHYPKFWDKYKNRERNTSDILKEGYILITFEQFQKYVLNQNKMDKKILGYRFKPGYEGYEKAAITITDSNYGFADFFKNHAGGNYEKLLREAGVLDLWFEPIYEAPVELAGYKLSHDYLGTKGNFFGCFPVSSNDIRFLNRLLNHSEAKAKLTIAGKDIDKEFLDKLLKELK